MRQIVNGKLYSTETATSLASIKNSAVLYELTKEYVEDEKYLLHPELTAAMEQLDEQSFHI